MDSKPFWLSTKGMEDKPWSQKDIDEFMESAKQSVQRAKDELQGVGVEEMKPADILNEGKIINTTDEDDLVVMYRGEKFTVSIDHPEL